MAAILLFLVVLVIAFVNFTARRSAKASVKRPDYQRTNPAVSEILAREKQEAADRKRQLELEQADMRKQEMDLIEQRRLQGIQNPGFLPAGSVPQQPLSEAAALERRRAHLESELKKLNIPKTGNAKTQQADSDAVLDLERRALIRSAASFRLANVPLTNTPAVTEKPSALRELEDRRIRLESELQQQRTLTETGTSYAANLQRTFDRDPINFRFDTVRVLAGNYAIPGAQSVPGTDTLESMSQYLHKFGPMHQAKLQAAFDAIFAEGHLELSGQKLEIVDYGCGQGIATVCLLDYLKLHTNRRYKLAAVRLIEPSAPALKRAAMHVRLALRSAGQPETVYAIRRPLDQIDSTDLATGLSTVKIHLFAHTHDTTFDVCRLQEGIAKTQSGDNYFVCISPDQAQDGKVTVHERLQTFQSHFASHGAVKQISERRTQTPEVKNATGAWKRDERIFAVRLDPYAAETTATATA